MSKSRMFSALASGRGQKLWRPRRDGRGLHDGRRRLPMNKKTIQHPVKRSNFGQVDLQNETIFAGDSMAFHDLGNLLSKRRNLWHVSGKWPDSDERGDIV